MVRFEFFGSLLDVKVFCYYYHCYYSYYTSNTKERQEYLEF